MPKPARTSRRIALFVEGYTERDSLSAFFHKWLDPQLPAQNKVGIQPVKFEGVSNYLDNLAQHIELFLTERRANFIVGLVDLYGLPLSRFDFFKDCFSVKEKVLKAQETIQKLVPKPFTHLFRQHFSVHEVEAWLLAYPEKFPANVRSKIQKRPPEKVNFDEPPAKFLKNLLGKSYKKTVTAKNIFPNVDPQIAIDKCPYLKVLAEDLLHIAKNLQ